MVSLVQRLGVVVGALLLSLCSLLAPAALAQPSSGIPTGEELAKNIAPSVVAVQLETSGYVGFTTVQGARAWTNQPVVSRARCSAFFVTSTGHLVTAGHCVDKEENRVAVLAAFMDQLEASGSHKPEERAANMELAIANWLVEGHGAGTPPAVTATLLQPKTVSGIVIPEPRAAQIIDYRAFDQGDVALLKVEIANTPALPIAAADPPIGASVTAVGFPGVLGQTVDPATLSASFKSGTVSSLQTSPSGVARIEVNADMQPGMSGGPAVDRLGNVDGVNSSGIRGGQAFNFITDTTDLREWLTGKGLQLPPPRTPAQSEAGSGFLLWVITVAAVVVVLMLAGVGVWLFLRRSRRSREQTHPTNRPHSGPAGPPRGGSAAVAPYCGRCGKPNPSGQRFCSNCGAPLSPSEEQSRNR